MHKPVVRLIRWLEGGFFLHRCVFLLDDWLLRYHLDGSLDLWFDDKDVAPDFVSELDAASLHPEVGGVPSLLFRCLALDSDFTVRFSLDLVSDLDWLGANVVASILEELDISRP